MEKISWTDGVRNEEVLRRVKEERSILHIIKAWKANWIGHILRIKCFPKNVTDRRAGKTRNKTEAATE
jgi:DNA-binding helix-hairpin-helix protein with protein kinase domain